MNRYLHTSAASSLVILFPKLGPFVPLQNGSKLHVLKIPENVVIIFGTFIANAKG